MWAGGLQGKELSVTSAILPNADKLRQIVREQKEHFYEHSTNILACALQKCPGHENEGKTEEWFQTEGE